MKPKIKGTWIVGGFYRFESETSTWEYECEYGPDEMIWEFDGRTIICRMDGSLDHTIPYRIVGRRTLVMDFSSLFPPGDRYLESCRIERRGRDLWLLDSRSIIPGVGSYALKLSRPDR